MEVGGRAGFREEVTFELCGVSCRFTFLKTGYVGDTHIREIVGDEVERKEGGSWEGFWVLHQGIQNVWKVSK